jgi:acyl carrier protein
MTDSTLADVLAQSVAFVSRFCGRPITAETSFLNDLQLDSIEYVRLIAEIEDHFSVVVPEDRLRSLVTVADAAECIVMLQRRTGE